MLRQAQHERKEGSGALEGAPVTPRIQVRVAVPFALVTLIWSSTWLVIRGQLAASPPIWSVSNRFAIAGVAMLAYAALTRSRLRLTRSEAVWAMSAGASQYVLNYIFVYEAEVHIASGLVALLFALLILPNTLLAWVFLGERLSRRFLIGSGIAVLGLGLLFAHDWRNAQVASRDVALGIGFTLLGVLFSSIANVMQGAERIRAVPTASLVAWAMLTGAAIDIVLAFTVAGPPRFDLPASYWAATLFLALIGSTLSFPLYYHVIREIGSARAAYSSLLTPFIAMGLSTMFEGYRWSIEGAAGSLLAILGLFVALRARFA